MENQLFQIVVMHEMEGGRYSWTMVILVSTHSPIPSVTGIKYYEPELWKFSNLNQSEIPPPPRRKT